MKIEELIKRQGQELAEIETKGPVSELLKCVALGLGLAAIVITLIFGVLHLTHSGFIY